MQKTRHSIDLIFPIALLFVFAASALVVLLLSIHLYSASAATQQQSDALYTPISYITEKVHQNDDQGQISLSSVEGLDCLILTANYNGTTCETYIYEQNGYLCELFTTKEANVSLKNGTRIMELYHLSLEEGENGIFRVTTTDETGSTASILLTERSVAHEP